MNHENGKQSSSLEWLRNSKTGNVLGIVLTSASLGVGVTGVNTMMAPERADAAPADVTCTTETRGNASVETCASEDGSYRSVTETTIEGGAEPREMQPTAPTPVKKKARVNPGNPAESRKTQQKAKQERKANSQKNFKGYDMQASPFTDGNGCFITSVASALRRETGNSNIKPTSNKLYHPELRRRWTPGGGVVRGAYLFQALPAMAARYNVKVSGSDSFNSAAIRRAIRRNDEVVILAQAGHFTAGGHYMAIRGLTQSGRFVIDDPNGKGRHGDSERKRGWSGSELKAGGVIAYRVLSRKNSK